ncbi:S16 family serine protease [Cellulomonas sp. ATA003]|uniref:YlbL family protein n=1 Tax=Cellulomonas sp. ATA003 TaxID=3073064 RepID=UPI0028731519|nr:S16 family serine protease [Cellulomonas sp. ATA003]WNB86135.1 S16 family serine protease [Cellulomonas sp. ATA003]
MPEPSHPSETVARAQAGADAEPLVSPVDDRVAGADPAAVDADADGDGAAPDAPMAPSPRSVTLSIAVLVTLLLLTVLVFLRVPYAVSAPGPTRDTLGEVDGRPLIEVEGTATYESTGELLLTTVSVAGGPGYPVTLPQVVAGWVSSARTVRPVEAVFAPDITQDQLDQQNQAAMTSSQESATVAALEELGYEVPAELLVAGAVEGTGAAGVVQEGDVLVAFRGEPVESYTALIGALDTTEPGTTVTLSVLRDGKPLDLDVVTGERPDGGSQLGVFIDPQFDLPVDVTIRIDDIGGPSAGLMFALGIVDHLTPEDEVAGEVVAGTGTMDVDGAVGPIGGIRQKLAGAERDGADWFLAPSDNCAEVVGHVPDGLRVVRVATLAEGRDAIEAIGAGTADDLATCTG